jgi:hypothetical protein
VCVGGEEGVRTSLRIGSLVQEIEILPRNTLGSVQALTQFAVLNCVLVSAWTLCVMKPRSFVSLPTSVAEPEPEPEPEPPEPYHFDPRRT